MAKKTVNLGDDTDTTDAIAAVAGGLTGLIYGCSGEKGIPSKWISQIPRKEWIKNYVMNLKINLKNII